jgi:CRISPR-associated protein (TIGR03984 family)
MNNHIIANSRYKTETISVQNLPTFIEEKLSFITSGYAVCWLHYGVLIGLIRGSKIQYPEGIPDYEHQLVRMRIFNQHKEWHIWKSENNYHVRYREENTAEGDDAIFTDRELVLWGTQCHPLKPPFQEVSERRGTGLVLPNELGKIENDKTRFVLKTRNYIAYNEIGQAGYVDSRFVDFQLKTF